MKHYLLIVLLVLLAACTPTAPQMMAETSQQTAMEQKNVMEPDQSAPELMKTDELNEKEVMMQKKDLAMTNEDVMSEITVIGGDVSKYYWWNPVLFEKAVNEGKLVYLEFSANWCPVCKQQEKDLIAGFETLDNQNVIGFKIPYKDSDTTDEHTALARKYGIAYQHTKVILRNGTVALKSPEAWSSDRFVTEVNQLG